MSNLIFPPSVDPTTTQQSPPPPPQPIPSALHPSTIQQSFQQPPQFQPLQPPQQQSVQQIPQPQFQPLQPPQQQVPQQIPSTHQQVQQPQVPQQNPLLSQLQNPQMIKSVVQLIEKLPQSDLNKIQKHIQTTIEKSSDKCIFNHSVLKLPADPKNEQLTQIQNAYHNYIKRNPNERMDRVFKHFCPYCVCFNLGLICQDVTREFRLRDCTTSRNSSDGNGNNNNRYSSPKSYQLGHFIHAFNPYKPDHPLRSLRGRHVSESISFTPGTLLIPTGKILIQLLSLRHDTIADGVKIIQIMSKEKDIDDMRCYFRFLLRNQKLDNGYYKRTIDPAKLKNMNQKGDSSELLSQQKLETLQNLYKNAKLKNVSGFENIDEDSIIGLPADQNFNMDNIYQNGEPLTYVKRGEKPSADEIKMKIFDLNIAFCKYIQTMINIQAHEESKLNNEDDLSYVDDDDDDDEGKRKKKNYLSIWKSAEPILNSVFFNMLMLGFYNEMHVENIANIPPFNNKCVTIPQNIIFVNEDGDFITTSKSDTGTSSCSIFNKVLKHSNVPLQQKAVVTGSNQNVNSKGIPPPSIFPESAVDTVREKLQNGTPDVPISDKFKIITNYHSYKTQAYHNQIKNNPDRYKNYYCKFLDDMGNPVKLEDNEVAYDISTRIFPQVILQSTPNKSMHSIHFADMATTKPVLEEDSNPNCIYVKNLGFVNLTSICDNSPLILKDTSVYLENLVKKDVHGFSNKTNDNCAYSDDMNDNDDTTRTMSSISIESIPLKRKFDPNVTIDLIGKKTNNFNYNAYNNLTNCQSPINFQDYVKKYGSPDDGKCLRGI